MTRVAFTVDGKPRGKGRPRLGKPRQGGRGHAHTPDDTVIAEQAVRQAWMAAGRVWLGEGPLAAKIVAVHGRPRSHFRADGVTLSAKGVREFAPMVKPDGDNLEKLVLDALNDLAYRDDVQVVRMVFERRWATRDERAHVRVILATVERP